MAFVIDLFHQVVYEYDRHTVVADFTDQWPQYNVYDPKGHTAKTMVRFTPIKPRP